MEILAAFSGLIPKRGGIVFLESFILPADSSVCIVLWLFRRG